MVMPAFAPTLKLGDGFGLGDADTVGVDVAPVEYEVNKDPVARSNGMDVTVDNSVVVACGLEVACVTRTKGSDVGAAAEFVADIESAVASVVVGTSIAVRVVATDEALSCLLTPA